MEDSEIIEGELLCYSDIDIANVLSELEKHDREACNNNKVFTVAYKAQYNDNYKGLGLKRSSLEKCNFNGADFTDAAVTGSRFINSYFKDCIISGANFQFCNFSGSTLTSTNVSARIESSNFSQSNFSNTKIIDLKICGCTFSQVLFENAEIENCDISLCTFENSVFKNSSLKNLELTTINLDFVDFNDVRMDNVTLPFFQIPYTFGGLSYLFSTADEVWISSKKSIDKRISVDEYYGTMKELAIYYAYIKEYFPLANIYIAIGMNEKALPAIIKGAEDSIKISDFRMLKYFCKLAATNFPTQVLKQIYEQIEKHLPVHQLTNGQLHDYLIHIGEIRSMLLNNTLNKPMLEIGIKTNIEFHEETQLSLLVKCINRILSEIGSSTKSTYIELRHNSPYELLISCSDKVCFFLQIVAAIYNLFEAFEKFKEFENSLVAKDKKWEKYSLSQSDLTEISSKFIEAKGEIHKHGIKASNINPKIIYFHPIDANKKIQPEKKTVKIFVASSSELDEERKMCEPIVQEVNKFFPHLNLEVVQWEKDIESGSYGKRIQDKINPYLLDSDILIALFYSKVGPFTLEEYNLALDRRKKVFVYFKTGFTPRNRGEYEAYGHIFNLKEQILSDNQTLHVDYANTDDFKDKLMKDLNLYLENY